MNDPTDEVARTLNEIVELLDERIREAHATLKDLRDARKELEETYRTAVNGIASAHKKALDEVMPGYMSDLRDAVGKAIEAATASVYKRFDTLAAILMGDNDPSKEPLAVLVQRWKEKRGL